MQTLNTNAECAPPAGAYIRDKDGNILKDTDCHYRVDVTKTDPYRPHVGQWSDVKPASWTEERSTFMTSVSRVLGMNAMSVFHDQWAVSWDMNTSPPLAQSCQRPLLRTSEGALPNTI